jgi:hypothetical protein
LRKTNVRPQVVGEPKVKFQVKHILFHIKIQCTVEKTSEERIMKFDEIKTKVTDFCRKVGKRNFIIFGAVALTVVAIAVNVAVFSQRDKGYDYDQSAGMDPGTTNTTPDTTPKEAHPPAGILRHHKDNSSIARYVWLPIQWEGDHPVIRWHSSWRWEDFL